MIDRGKRSGSAPNPEERTLPGKEFLNYMLKGDLVQPELISDIMKERIMAVP